MPQNQKVAGFLAGGPALRNNAFSVARKARLMNIGGKGEWNLTIGKAFRTCLLNEHSFHLQ
jgi:hypothetical protein